MHSTKYWAIYKWSGCPYENNLRKQPGQSAQELELVYLRRNLRLQAAELEWVAGLKFKAWTKRMHPFLQY